MKRDLLAPDAKIAIINRGEAAVRFIRATKEYNTLNGTSFESVALYIEAESDALFVKEADHALCLGEFPHYDQLSGSPYLNAEFILSVLQSFGCEGVWVGWGFLAEDPGFALLLESHKIVLIGPTSTAMELLGDKIKAKELADQTKVPTTPWSGRPLKDLEDARQCAASIGYPVILKSANGGGGRGIRKVFKEADLDKAFTSVSDEIFRFFGNRIIFMEALVAKGRHLEVQAVADYYGNVETFGVRDCSVQRNNQKIIEETPPAHMKRQTIEALEQGSRRLLKAADYHGAGTVEYLYDIERDQFFFMEVNTRLQVEHPISEELYHTDLVQLQIHVACGGGLEKFRKETPIGHVIEVRLNAEDPENRFAPTPGKIKRYLPPQLPGIRLDSGIEWGSTIPKEFDSMIAKIIAKGPDRKSAIAKLTRALRELQIEIDNGTTNQGFLLELLNSKEIREGGVQTDFVEQYLERAVFQLKSDWDVAIIAGTIYQYEQQFENDFENFAEKIRRFSLPRSMPHQGRKITIHHHGHKYSFLIRSMSNNIYHIELGNRQLVAEYMNWGHEIILKTKGKKHKLQIVPRAGALQCEINGVPYLIPLEAGGSIVAPSPSVVLTVEAKAGQSVNQGDLLLTLEAMKMEMTVTAPEDGLVNKILVKAGEQVAAGQQLVELDAITSDDDDKPKGTEEPISFQHLELSDGGESQQELEDSWSFLSREYKAVFTGFDYTQPVSSILGRLEDFTNRNPEFKPRLGQLILEACQSFTTIERLFRNERQSSSNTRISEYDECLMHYFLRREDREKGLPTSFLVRLEAAIALFPWAEKLNYNDTTLALFHIYKSFANRADKVELARLSLFSLQKLDIQHRVCTYEELSEILNQLIQVADGQWVLVDAAIHTRYNLVDKVSQDKVKKRRTALVADLLNSVLDKKDAATSEAEVIESGHQIVSHLLSLQPADEEHQSKILELVGKRFNRDRLFLEHEFIRHEKGLMYGIRTSKNGETYTTLLKIMDEAEYFEDLNWINEPLAKLDEKNRELILLIRRTATTSELKFIKHLELFPLQLDHCYLGLYAEDNGVYRSFEHGPSGLWQESVRNRYLSPLRYRELRLDRLENFDLELVYHSQFVHVMKLEAKTNDRDQRIFAFVEIPETKIELDEDQVIQRIGNFEYGILEAIQAIREQQSRQKRKYFWNRIIVHIGQTHPLKLDQIGEYPKTISNLIQGLGLEKITIYTKIAGRQRQAIEAEVLVENFATRYTIRGRLPSREQLQPLDPYTSKVVRSLRRASHYPYEVIRMLTNVSSDDFPSGRFEEYDIQFDVNGQQKIVSVEGRPYGSNVSNTVFGKIYNRTDSNTEFERVIILGDPSRDLGSLAEDECRRVIAAIDLAEAQALPIEWIPVSSGAAIDMTTGTENLDWTARVLRRIIEFTQSGGEINIIVSGINVGAQSYWNAEATMLQHTRGLLIMTEDGTMVLTGKKALDFSGSVSAEDNIGIGGVERIMAPNGQAQFRVSDLAEAYKLLFRHYHITYKNSKIPYGRPKVTNDPIHRNVCTFPYSDPLNQGFTSIGDILGQANKERKKPFDMRQVMQSVCDQDADIIERWHHMRDAETAIVWECQVGGQSTAMIGIESKPLKRYGDIPNDGPDSWTGGTLYPLSSKKVSRAINAFSNNLPLVVLANLSGFDGSPESLRKLQLEYGAEIGRAVVNFKGPFIFVVISRYHGGAYVVFSKTLNPNMKVAALENTFASVIGGAPAAAVVFPREVLKNTFSDPQIITAQERLRTKTMGKAEYDDLFQKVHLEHQAKLAQKFEKIHSVERALKVGSIDEIIAPETLRPYIAETLASEIEKFVT